MSTIALVMAGGRGERMRSSGVPVPKPLVKVRGVTLIERNLYALFRAGFGEIIVSTPADSPEINGFVRSRGEALARAVGATIRALPETSPLGNIGSIGALRGRREDVLVVFSDNLTTVDLREMAERHRRRGAALTLAAHLYPFRLPFGELAVEGERIVRYTEKPQEPRLICSGIAVVGPRAIGALPPGEPAGLSDLFRAVAGRGDAIEAFRHDAPWIDVNDAVAVQRAEELLAAHAEAFDCWAPAPPPGYVMIVAQRGGDVLLPGGRSDGQPAGRTLPMAMLAPDENPLSAVQRLLQGHGLPSASVRPLARFDDLAPGGGAVARYHLFLAALTDQPGGGPEGRWLPADEAAAGADSLVLRALSLTRAIPPREQG